MFRPLCRDSKGGRLGTNLATEPRLIKATGNTAFALVMNAFDRKTLSKRFDQGLSSRSEVADGSRNLIGPGQITRALCQPKPWPLPV
jgi:hypothetical protein